MPLANVDGVTLYYGEVGQGLPLVFVHEFAGDHRSWRPQVRFFARRYRTVAYNARGYPPSAVPEDPAAYSQDRAVDDIRGLLDALGIRKAHVCGLSMGGYATLHFGLRYPDRAFSLVVAGAGYGSVAGDREKFRQEAEPDDLAAARAPSRRRARVSPRPCSHRLVPKRMPCSGDTQPRSTHACDRSHRCIPPWTRPGSA
jgi:pimeloyl-ACP methyl ester carboxylesterase